MKEQHPWKIISERINILLRIINVSIFLGVSNLLILNLVICAQNSQWTFSSCQVVSSRRHFSCTHFTMIITSSGLKYFDLWSVCSDEFVFSKKVSFFVKSPWDIQCISLKTWVLSDPKPSGAFKWNLIKPNRLSCWSRKQSDGSTLLHKMLC